MCRRISSDKLPTGDVKEMKLNKVSSASPSEHAWHVAVLCKFARGIFCCSCFPKNGVCGLVASRPSRMNVNPLSCVSVINLLIREIMIVSS